MEAWHATGFFTGLGKGVFGTAVILNPSAEDVQECDCGWGILKSWSRCLDSINSMNSKHSKHGAADAMALALRQRRRSSLSARHFVHEKWWAKLREPFKLRGSRHNTCLQDMVAWLCLRFVFLGLVPGNDLKYKVTALLMCCGDSNEAFEGCEMFKEIWNEFPWPSRILN